MMLKTRILIALSLMALLIVSLAVASTYFVQRLGSASENILKDNYRSIGAVSQMLYALDRMDHSVLYSRLDHAKATEYRNKFGAADSVFAYNLHIVENNVTEPGEKEVVSRLKSGYASYKVEATKEPASEQLEPMYDSLRASCLTLLDINTNGMNIRNAQAKEEAGQAVLYTFVLVGIALVLTVGMLVRFPRLVLKPISELTTKIRQIANRKYSEHIDVKSQDEIGELATSFNQMALRLEEYDRSNIDALIAEKKQSEAIVKNMNDGVVVLTRDLNIVMVNAVASQLLGVAENDLIGKSAKEVGQYNSIVAKLIKNIEPTNGTSEKEAYLQIYNEGKEEYYLKDVIRIERTEGDPATALGYVIELKNVSEFKALDEAKSGFVATVSHELRTPLSALNMSLRLLQDNRVGELNPEQVKIIEAMKQETRRLLRIVNELLELSRAEVGAEVMHIEPVTPESIVEAAVTPVMLQADQKRIVLEVDLPESLPKVRADNSKIAWVLINLLSNAIRFTSAGGKVKVQVVAQNNQVEFSVSDTGTGIEPQNLERIFEKFFQVREKPVEAHSGVGLGLAISREIIEAHGGRISAESEVGKGTTFTFFLRSL